LLASFHRALQSATNKCLKQGFVFLALVFLSPKEPRKQMNIFLHMLMEEMKELW
jgi:hypothetical protein